MLTETARVGLLLVLGGKGISGCKQSYQRELGPSLSHCRA